MYKTVVIDYQVGVAHNYFKRNGIDYVDVSVRGVNKVVRESELITLDVFLALARAAELEAFDWCRGTGRIDPIENPPYSCDHCSGKGYFVVKE